jgi:hypothetical protein
MCGLAAALFQQSSASAQSVGLPAPRLLTTTPMGGKVGTDVEIRITGENLEEAGDLSFSDPRLTASPKTGADGKVIPNVYVVKIAPDCPPGIYEARVMTRLGISSTRIFSVGTLDEVVETKPNTTAAEALTMHVGSVANGTLADRSIDFLKFEAKKGQRLLLDCAARGIDSKLTPTVIVADDKGRDLAVDRRAGFLEFIPPADGSYLIKIHDLTFKGNESIFYRLALRELKPGEPIALQPGTSAVNAFSWPPAGLATAATLTEADPDDAGGKPQKVTLPMDVAGRFFPAADTDVYEFEAKKGETWWVEVASDRLGRPTDATVLVQKVTKAKGPDGKETETLADIVELTDVPSPVRVSSNGYAYDGPVYDAGTADPMGKVEIKEDGVYRLRITDLFGGTRRDPDNVYRLIVRQAKPDFALVGWAIHMELRNGDRNALSKPLALRGGTTMALEVVAYRRDGFDGPIDLALEGLPEGVTASGLKIPAGQSRGMVLVTASENAPRGFARAKFVGRAEVGGEKLERAGRLASVSWPIPDSWGEIPSPRLVADVPVSVSGFDKSTITVAPKSQKIDAKAGEKLTIPLTITRRSEFSGASFPVKAIGAGFESVAGFEMPLNADKAEAVVDLNALKLPPGDHMLSFIGGAVAKYRHRPDLVTTAEADVQKAKAEVEAAAAEVKTTAETAKSASPEAMNQAKMAAEAANAREKAAKEVLTKAEAALKVATDAAQPRDIADIVVVEPIHIHVQPAEKQ